MMNRALLLLLAVAGFLGITGTSRAQVLVYKLDFSGAKGINFHTFEGGYVVVPLLGGSASFLLTSTHDDRSTTGRSLTESSEGGTFFTAVTGSGDQKAVLSATTGGGTAEGAIVALGDIDHLIKVNNRTLSLSARVAKRLHGTIVSADAESEAEEPGVDGSIGSAGVADVKLLLDEDETNDSNREGDDIAKTIERLKEKLDRKGFSPVEGDDDDDDDDDDDGGVTPPPTATPTTP
jgi:hypothetical protein